VTPRVQLGYSDYTLSGLRESGGETALQIDELNLQRLEGRAGVKLAGATSIAPGWSIVPQLQADFVHLLSGADTGMNVRFASAPDLAFALPLAGGSTSWAEAKGGVKLVNGPMEIGAGMQTSLGRTSLRDDRAVLDFSLRF
jgi:outer membrane autotransporter protein